MRRIGQVEAKKGDFIESFDSKKDFMEHVRSLEALLKFHKSERELVYVIVPSSKNFRKVQWQLFLLPPEAKK